MAIFEINNNNFEKEVIESELPVIADLWAPWCGPCKALHHVVESVAAAHEGKVKVVKINIDESPSLAAKYHVMSIPTLLFFKGGKIESQIIGLVNQAKIESKLNPLL